MIDEFNQRKKLIIKLLSEIDGFNLNNPDGAFYVFPDVSKFFGKTIRGSKIENSSDFAMFLLEKAHVATVTGEAFGCPDNIRISYAASKENITKAVKRIKSVLS
jgi:aspartate aminotransferase